LSDTTGDRTRRISHNDEIRSGLRDLDVRQDKSAVRLADEGAIVEPPLSSQWCDTGRGDLIRHVGADADPEVDGLACNAWLGAGRCGQTPQKALHGLVLSHCLLSGIPACDQWINE
jgi:hypothetical protein